MSSITATPSHCIRHLTGTDRNEHRPQTRTVDSRSRRRWRSGPFREYASLCTTTTPPQLTIQQDQYARKSGLRVIALDTGPDKKNVCLATGAEAYIDVLATPDPAEDVCRITRSPGVNGVIVAAGSTATYKNAADMLRSGSIMSCCGIAPDYTRIETPAAAITIKNLKIMGNLMENT